MPRVDGVQQPELRSGSPEAEGSGVEVNRPRPGFKNGRFPRRPLDAPQLANGGNQFSLVPPDQALCVGNGFTIESVNSALRVYDAGAAPLTGAQDLNTFFGYPAAINRATGVVGPNVIDPVCHFDPVWGRFVVAITTLHVATNGAFNGRNTIDVAVSNTGDPTGAWTVYSVPAQNVGTEGTPNHHCTLDGTEPGPCQDYPHLQGLRRDSAPDPLGRLRRSPDRRPVDLAGVRVHRPDVHPPAVPDQDHPVGGRPVRHITPYAAGAPASPALSQHGAAWHPAAYGIGCVAADPSALTAGM